MDWKKYFINFFPSVGGTSIILLFIQLIWTVSDDFELLLLGVYIIIALYIILMYHLLPMIINNFLSNRKLFYTVSIIAVTALWTLIDIIFSIFNFQEKKINSIFLAIPFMLATLTIVYTIIYFVQNAYYKRMNKKLDEYKQKSDDK